jgi:serine/threonine protein kinase
MAEDPYLKLSALGRCTGLSRIGEGGMGVVYKGHHTDLDLDVAIKFLHQHLAKRSGTADRFLREARLAARLHSSGIVRVFDCGIADGHSYIIMEFVEGQTLEDHLKERHTVPVARALQITEAIAQALKEALDQIGLIHRDIKPANILITPSGQVKLADFGLAKIQEEEGATAFTAAGTALGTPSYMSPEQFADASQVDHRADIFSLGATLYQMIAGHPPFQGDTYFSILKKVEEEDPAPLPSHVPSGISSIIERMMAKRPEDRFQKYDELLSELRKGQHSLGTPANLDTQTVITHATTSVSHTIIPRVKAMGQSVRPATPTENRVLIVVDIQNDFCPKGALAVPGGDEIVPIINKMSRRFSHVILTQDWHCEDHLSFATSHPGKKPLQTVQLTYGDQMLWPDHCVQNTEGAEFHPKLAVSNCELVIRKGYHREIDSYSAFFENDRQTPTGLAGYLRERGLTRLFVVGLATDFCVAYTALDARKLGFEVTVIEDACRGIGVEGSIEAAWVQMLEAGVIRA